MADHVGQQLGNYRLNRLLGQGGFANVYQGEHVYLKTQAAIKVLRARLAISDQDNFLNEARTIAALDHQHIVRVLEFGVEPHDDIPFLVMTYAPHGTLRERHPKGSRLSLASILPYVRQRSEEHTSELQSPDHLVCRLLLEKKKTDRARPRRRG